MLQKLKDYIQTQQLFDINDRILLAVSGGVDSMVLVHLFSLLPYYFEVAHMNFGLRGAESDGDEQFVEEYCAKHKIKLHVKKADTHQYITNHKVSVQMAARDLRYKWFEELKRSNQLKSVITAHHSDDSVETIFINIIRGTGIKGLRGIINTEKAIRPLLRFTRAEIIEYAHLNGINWREDSSNAKEDYLRNKLRHTILPLFDELNESWRENLIQLSDDMVISESILSDYYLEHLSSIYTDGRIYIEKRKGIAHFSWLLRKLLVSLNFTHDTISDIVENLTVQTGKEFESSTHRLIKEHTYFDVLLKEEQVPFNDSLFILEEDQSIELEHLKLDIHKLDVGSFNNKYIPGDAFLDFNKLKFPLLLRKWQHGDWFIPYGMKGRKKLSDFFVDEKFTIKEKENTFVIVSGEDIVCILGHRTDDRYRITETTSIIYNIKQKHG